MDGILIKMNLKEKNIKLHNLVLEKKWTTLLATIVIRLEDFILCQPLMTEQVITYIIVTDMEGNIRIYRLPKGRGTDQWK
jgi:hypothetical protein